MIKKYSLKTSFIYRVLTFSLLFLGNPFISAEIRAQTEDLFIPRDILEAYQNGSRSYNGNPGPNYFQNQVDYHIDAEFDPLTRELTGSSTITFHNNSPEDLRFILLRNYYEIFRKGAARGKKIDPIDAGTGTDLISLTINNRKLDLEDPDIYLYSSATNDVFPCITPSGRSSEIEIKWKTTLPDVTHDRFGRVGPASFFIAYWFPQVAMYDDINGWDFFDWDNVSEMYNEYGNFNVSIKVPEGYVIWATGELQNPEKVLDEQFLKRFQESKRSSIPIEIIDRKALKKEVRITRKGSNTWEFHAENVNDFAFAVSKEHLWTASSKPIANNNVHIHTAFLPASGNFHEVPEITPWTLEMLSDSLPGVPYPYPTFTVFNGKAGMEFPMICNNREFDSREGTWFLTVHEVAHSYLPFMVGVNQKRHGWIDEGLITLIGVELHMKKVDDFDFREIYLKYYPSVAGTQGDVPTMVNSVFLPEILFQQHEYMRPSLAFWTLRDVLGHEVFKSCLRAFIKRWKGKHPTPYDLFFTINETAGENLNWFYQPWFVEFAWPDLGIKQVSEESNYTEIIIENVGGMPFPCQLEIFFSTGETELHKIDARVWKDKAEHVVKIYSNKTPVSCVLKTENYPDSNEDNNLMDF
jgi:hypothetical protein